MILTNSFRVFSPKQLNLGKSNFGQESDELLFQSQRILLTITKSHFSSRIQNQSKFVDWPAKISLAHKSRRRDRKFVANTRDSNRISKLSQKQPMLPYKISCIKGSSDIPLISLLGTFSETRFCHHPESRLTIN